MKKTWDILGVGNAIVDVLAQGDEAMLQRHNLRKGAMALVSEKEAEDIYQSLSNSRQVAGGAVANSCVGVASLGGRAAYIGKVKDDPVGRIFADDMQRCGVHYQTPMAKDGAATARSMIIVTPDGQRTMNTYLGACIGIEKEDVDPHLIAHSKITFIEGYLWDVASIRPYLQLAAGLVHAAEKRLAFTLSDAWLIDRHRADMRKFVHDHVDILFANESEIVSFYQTSDLDMAIEHLAKDCDLGIVTRSEQGSVVVHYGKIIPIEACPVKVVDTTGAGDLYAAGFLFGLAQNYPLPICGKIASLCASEIIGHIGARPEVNLAELIERHLALPHATF